MSRVVCPPTAPEPRAARPQPTGTVAVMFALPRSNAGRAHAHDDTRAVVKPFLVTTIDVLPTWRSTPEASRV